MPTSVALDATALAALADRVAHCATALSELSIAEVSGLTGSALAASAAPRRATAEVHRHAQTASRWVAAARRCIDEFTAAERDHIEGLRVQ